jgi:hypothetical protein
MSNAPNECVLFIRLPLARATQPGIPEREPDIPVKPGQPPEPIPIDPDPQGVPPDYRDPAGPWYQDEPPPVPIDSGARRTVHEERRNKYSHMHVCY